MFSIWQITKCNMNMYLRQNKTLLLTLIVVRFLSDLTPFFVFVCRGQHLPSHQPQRSVLFCY